MFPIGDSTTTSTGIPSGSSGFLFYGPTNASWTRETFTFPGDGTNPSESFTVPDLGCGPGNSNFVNFTTTTTSAHKVATGTITAAYSAGSTYIVVTPKHPLALATGYPTNNVFHVGDKVSIECGTSTNNSTAVYTLTGVTVQPTIAPSSPPNVKLSFAAPGLLYPVPSQDVGHYVAESCIYPPAGPNAAFNSNGASLDYTVDPIAGVGALQAAIAAASPSARPQTVVGTSQYESVATGPYQFYQNSQIQSGYSTAYSNAIGVTELDGDTSSNGSPERPYANGTYGNGSLTANGTCGINGSLYYLSWQGRVCSALFYGPAAVKLPYSQGAQGVFEAVYENSPQQPTGVADTQKPESMGIDYGLGNVFIAMKVCNGYGIPCQIGNQETIDGGGGSCGSKFGRLGFLLNNFCDGGVGASNCNYTQFDTRTYTGTRCGASTPKIGFYLINAIERKFSDPNCRVGDLGALGIQPTPPPSFPACKYKWGGINASWTSPPQDLNSVLLENSNGVMDLAVWLGDEVFINPGAGTPQPSGGPSLNGNCATSMDACIYPLTGHGATGANNTDTELVSLSVQPGSWQTMLGASHGGSAVVPLKSILWDADIYNPATGAVTGQPNDPRIQTYASSLAVPAPGATSILACPIATGDPGYGSKFFGCPETPSPETTPSLSPLRPCSWRVSTDGTGTTNAVIQVIAHRQMCLLEWGTTPPTYYGP